MTPGQESAPNRLIEEFFREYWKLNCSSATFNGIHDYDHELDHWSAGDRTVFGRRCLEWKSEIISVLEKGGISSNQRMDLEILLCEIEKGHAEERYFNRFERDPSLYPSSVIMSCLVLQLRDFAPKEERLLSLVRRLKDTGRFMAEAKENLLRADTIPEVWLKMAKESVMSSRKYFTSIITQTAGEGGSLRNDLMAAGTLAAKVFDDYADFLDVELARREDGSFAAGREFFDYLLKKHHLLPYDAAQLENIGIEYIETTLKEMMRIAGELGGKADLKELIEEIKRDTPRAETLEEHYRQVVRRTRDFVVERELVSFPGEERLEIIPTPATERATLPYAAYMQPAPFERAQVGFFWVTPIDVSRSPQEQEEQLSGHSKAAIEVRALHEGYPGHHLQLCHANRIDSKVRRVFGTNVFVEGWALYCEELMKEQGFYSDRRTDLIQLKDQLWRACRVVIDVGLHTGGLSFEQATAMLVEKAMLEPSSAVAEVRRYTQSPTQPMSYLIGKIEIMKLAAEYREKFPKNSLREFHDKLLSYGSAPVTLVRREMMGT